MSNISPERDIFGILLDFPAEKDFINNYYISVLEYQPFASWQRIMHLNPGSTFLLALQMDYLMSSGGDVAILEKQIEQRKGYIIEREKNDKDTSEQVAESLAEQFQKLLSHTEKRAWKYLSAMKSWSAGNFEKAYRDYVSVLLSNPTDLFAVKRAQLMGLILGNPGKIYGASLKISEWAESIPSKKNTTDKKNYSRSDDPRRYWYGMHAFSLEQIGDWRRAETIAQKGLQWFHDIEVEIDPWLLHSCVHICHNAAKWGDCIEYLEKNMEKYNLENLHVFLYTHFWWHLAITYIEKALVDAKALVGGNKPADVSYDNRMSFSTALRNCKMIIRDHLWDCHFQKESNKNPQGSILSDPQVQLNLLGVLWQVRKYAGKDEESVNAMVVEPKAASSSENDLKSSSESDGISGDHDFNSEILIPLTYCACRFSELQPYFVKNVDLLLDILFLGMLPTAAERRAFHEEMVAFSESSKGGNSGNLKTAAEMGEVVCDILDLTGEIFADVNLGVKNNKILQASRKRLHLLDWSCLGNSWEQRAVLEVL
mmetsp:Transcript_28367/g.64882  ORF Transcript_28367/g.64882 Transcript_28367/m.64882 type:complete len:540 (-) Transcript_28367:706-2325(-)